MVLRTMKIAVTTMNIKIKHKKIEHNPNQKKSIKKNSEKSNKKEIIHTLVPQTRGRRRRTIAQRRSRRREEEGEGAHHTAAQRSRRGRRRRPRTDFCLMVYDYFIFSGFMTYP